MPQQGPRDSSEGDSSREVRPHAQSPRRRLEATAPQIAGVRPWANGIRSASCSSHRYVRYTSKNGNEFRRKIKKLVRKRGIAVSFDRGHGKGSHGRLSYGDRFTTLKDRKKEIGPGLLNAMLVQLGLTKADLED
jgi:mRNA interferase HicA